MIKYSLVCDNGHEFESWFPSSEGYESQARRGLVACPQCSSVRVSKALMAPSVSTSRKRRAAAMIDATAQQVTPAAARPAPAPSPAPAGVQQSPMALLDENHRKLREAVRELHEKIAETTDDVGRAFPEEARKMHEGDAPARSIRGEATLDEARELWEDGIPVLPVPALPEDRN